MIKYFICNYCWAKNSCNGNTHDCCVSTLFKTKPVVSKNEVIEWCCMTRCNHDEEYHEICPLNKAGISKEHYW